MTAAQSLSRQTLEETPSRVLVFLRAVGTNAVIRTALATRGYTSEDHAEGWQRLHRVAGYGQDSAIFATDDVQKAIAEIDAWDEPTFRVCRAALERLHPDQPPSFSRAWNRRRAAFFHEYKKCK